MLSKSYFISKFSVANVINQKFARKNVEEALTFDSGFAVWVLADKAYVSLFSWDIRIPGCVGTITHVDCDRWESLLAVGH